MPEGFKKGDLAPEPSAEMIEAGKRVYFTKCVWCHGVDGAGDGPGADRLWPRPRNFNQGTFKIRHTASGELPLFDARKPVPGQNDLFETVTHGLPGSAMPSWEGILTEEQRLQVLSFVTTQLVKDRKFTDKESESPDDPATGRSQADRCDGGKPEEGIGAHCREEVRRVSRC